MKDMGNQCDLITIPEGVHGMGGWDKLNSDYKEQLVAWLKTTLNAKGDASVAATLTDLGAQVTHTDGVVTKVIFKDCSKLGDAEFRLIGQLKELKSLTLYCQCKGLTDETLPHLASLTNLGLGQKPHLANV